MILRNCKFVSSLVEGFNGEYGDIVVDGDKIEGIYPCGEVDAGEHEEVDVKNKYTFPGFIDAHVHFSASATGPGADKGKSAVQLTIESYSAALASLKSGFTTLRDVGAPYGTVIAVREAINKGQLVGPNIFASGRYVTPIETGSDSMAYEVADASDMRGAVRKAMQEGADFIKLMGTGSVLNSKGIPGQTICFDDEYEAIVEAAKFKGTYVAVHCHGTESIKSAIKAGCRTIEHASIMDDECIELLKKGESFAVPTFSAIVSVKKLLSEGTNSVMGKKADSILQSAIDGTIAAHNEGLKIGFATDQGVTGLLHGDNGWEFELRKELLNISTEDILKQATITNAEILGVEDRVGSIKKGKLADIVVVDGDPFENISVLRNNVSQVFKSGVEVK